MGNKEGKIPVHVAIIMDGNGRWAEQQGRERIWGHLNGVESVRASIRAAARNGVKYLTIYAFSTENWGRPQEEVDALMELFCKSVINETSELTAQGVKVVVIGDRSRLSEKVREHIALMEKETVQGQTLTLLMAINYSSTSEMEIAVRNIAQLAVKGEIAPENIDFKTIKDQLYTSAYPDPDLLIRTSGEQRLSNFMLLQLAYAELYFTQTLWPDFREGDFDKAVEAYACRNRRYGLINQTENFDEKRS